MTPPTDGMLRAMLDLQDSMNRKINPDWLTAGYPFLRAVLVEAVEGLDHYGWKWWKSQSPDLAQLRIELIDIWHFLLSEYLVRAHGDKAAAACALIQDWQSGARVEFDAGHTISSRSICAPSWSCWPRWRPCGACAPP